MASKKKKHQIAIQKEDPITLWGIAAITLLTIYLLFAPFNMGLFNGTGLHANNQFSFERKMLIGALGGGAALLLAAVYLLRQKMWEKRHLLGAIGIALPLIYWISSWQAESPYLAKIAVFMNVLLFAMYLLGVLISEQKQALHVISYIMVGIGYLITVFSFAFVMGNAYQYDALQFHEGLRLASFFTYPNANAAFMLIMILMALYFVTGGPNNKWKMVHGAMLVPIVTAFLLTLSRGAMVMLPLIALLTLLMFNMRRQIMMMIYFAVAGVLSFVLMQDLADRGADTYHRVTTTQPVERLGLFEGSSAGGWLYLLAATIVMAGITYVVQRYVEPVVNRTEKAASNKKGFRFLIPGVLVVLTVAAAGLIASGALNSVLPARLQDVTWRTHSVLERLYIYRDTIEIWKLNPIIGGGGGVWEALYNQYQDYPFSSAQTHSYVMQLLAEIGIVGLIFVVGLVGYILVSYARKYFKSDEGEQSIHALYFIIAISILLHSVIDFEMSYIYFGIVAFFCLGVLAGVHREEVRSDIGEKKAKWLRQGTASVSAVVGVVMLVAVGLSISANSQLTKSAQALSSGDGDINSIVDAGLKVVPGHPFLLNQSIAVNIQIYEQTKDTQYLDLAAARVEKLAKAEPNYAPLPNLQALLLQKQGDIEAAARTYEVAATERPYFQWYYDGAFNVRAELLDQARKDGNASEIEYQSEAIRAMYGTVETRLASLQRDMPKELVFSAQFGVTSAVRYAMGLVEFTAGDYEKAITMTQPGVTEALEDPSIRSVARVYLAALRKQGQDDAALNKKLIAADAGEADKLESLIAM